MQNVCEVLDKLKPVVATFIKAMTTANMNAVIVDEAVENITVETQQLSNMLAAAAGISAEEMGARVDGARTVLKLVDEDTVDTAADTDND